jgi:hypothetical protein
MSWNTATNRILDLYGRSTMTRQESHAKYIEVLSLECMYDHLEQELEADDMVRRGEPMEICPDTAWHTSDGRPRLYLTEEGVRTVIKRPNQAGASHQAGSQYRSLGYPGREGPSMGYGSQRS